MKELIKKLEAATEGSRELDADIAFAVGWTYEKRGRDRKPWWRKPEAERDSDTASSRFWSQYPKEEFTTSIDAALTLVPEGWRVAYLWEAVKPEDRPWWGAQLSRDKPYKTMSPVLGKETPALALCIAALKARA